MALSSAFRERLKNMEETRNQRLHLLQAEKELQERKKVSLSEKVENLRLMERRCLVLQQSIVARKCRVLGLKSEIATFGRKHQEVLKEIRALMEEVSELEEVEREKDRFYELKKDEMKESLGSVEKFFGDCRRQMDELRGGINQLKSRYMTNDGNGACMSNLDIDEAEMRKAELLYVKHNLESSLASNLQIRAQLQKQLQSILTMQSQARRKPSRCSGKTEKGN